MTLFDIDKKLVENALADIQVQIKNFENKHILKGNRTADQQIQLIQGEF